MISLWTEWPSIRRELASARQVALFLDYDGTLSPIVEHPSKARLPLQTRRLLRQVSARPGLWVAIVSGRALKDLRRRVGLKGLCYVGNHGLELQGPKMRHLNPAARRCRPTLRKIREELKPEARKIPGAWVEDKGLTLSVHSRQVKPRDKILVRDAFYRVVRPYQEKGQVRVTAGKEVFEVRPPVRWTKGTMVSWLLTRRRARAKGQKVVPVYIGDDITDEDAFKALGKRGITVAVGPGNALTRARYAVRSPANVRKFLRLLASLRA